MNPNIPSVFAHQLRWKSKGTQAKQEAGRMRSNEELWQAKDIVERNRKPLIASSSQERIQEFVLLYQKLKTAESELEDLRKRRNLGGAPAARTNQPPPPGPGSNGSRLVGGASTASNQFRRLDSSAKFVSVSRNVLTTERHKTTNTSIRTSTLMPVSAANDACACVYSAYSTVQNSWFARNRAGHRVDFALYQFPTTNDLIRSGRDFHAGHLLDSFFFWRNHLRGDCSQLSDCEYEHPI